MNNCRCILFLLVCLSCLGCAALLTEQTYTLVDQQVSAEPLYSGTAYSIAERVDLRKIVILGSGKIQYIDIHAREDTNHWKLVKSIKKAIQFPYVVLLRAETDTIKISHRTTTGKGSIDTIQFYTITEKPRVN
ncbi:MAG: hypothetical protein OXT74_16560 [Candidatus Poribacteria bacterium]|nr:hypothetical protein [Candidatus Poribacteria bacterium]